MDTTRRHALKTGGGVTLLTLLQDRAFRQALALLRFTRKVARLS